ncbi:MAG TPA: hypothetical protein VH041_14650 [Caldimonas sp.]|nr:hypothetical protein [Caldimonas sp.]HEX4235532.1 hypothetical protein [Caldimonas sp.]
MNVLSSTSSAIASLTGNSSLSLPSSASQVDADGGDGTKGTHHAHRGGGHGHVFSAVAQALQSLGLSVPASGSAAGASNDGSTTSSTATAPASSDTVRQDLQQFMHALFEAAKGEQASVPAASSSPNGAAAGDAGSRFADGLSALISQASAGKAPADLQSAFAKLTSDLQAAPAASSGSATGADSGGTSATLQAFLTNLQQDLGYGPSGAQGASAAGSLLTSQV